MLGDWTMWKERFGGWIEAIKWKINDRRERRRDGDFL